MSLRSIFFSSSASKEFKLRLAKPGSIGVSVARWYDFILHSEPVKKVLESLPKSARTALANPGPDSKAPRAKKAASPAVSAMGDGKKKSGASSAVSSSASPKEEGKFVALPGAEMGKVVVRFPPEASG